jgi:small ligand-binding sensory domain FIST
MKWASSASDAASLDEAMETVSGAVGSGLGGDSADLAFVFVSPHHAERFIEIPSLIARRLQAGLVIGCSGGGVIGAGHEIENRPGLSITAARLPGVDIRPFHFESGELPARTAPVERWQGLLGAAATERPEFVLLADPFSFDVESFIRGLDLAYPASRKIGGLASGGRQPGSNALFLGTDMHRSGGIGLVLTGDVEIDTVVAQGCRPVGDPMFVTRCDRNIIWQLDGLPPLKVIQQLHARLDERDRDLFRHSLFLGIAMSENREEYRPGDFLIRNLAGVDSSTGAIAVGALLEDNCIVQFHLRDAQTSAEEVEALLHRHRAESGGAVADGALLFSCLGRGEFLYGHPDHDTNAFRRQVGEIPLGGFFCNGEIGPVQGTTFLHGYTSAFGLFRRRSQR